MNNAATVHVPADDLARVVDAGCMSAGSRLAATQRIVDSGIDAAAVKKAVSDTTSVRIIPDDLVRVVDADARCADSPRICCRVVKRAVSTPAIEEAMRVLLGVYVIADYLV
jgi:hypothetical protein